MVFSTNISEWLEFESIHEYCIGAVSPDYNPQCCQLIRGWTVPGLCQGPKGWGLLVVGNWSMQCYVVTAEDSFPHVTTSDVTHHNHVTCHDNSGHLQHQQLCSLKLPRSVIIITEPITPEMRSLYLELCFAGPNVEAVCVSERRCCSLVYRVMNLNWFWKCFNWWKMHWLMVMQITIASSKSAKNAKILGGNKYKVSEISRYLWCMKVWKRCAQLRQSAQASLPYNCYNKSAWLSSLSSSSLFTLH